MTNQSENLNTRFSIVTTLQATRLRKTKNDQFAVIMQKKSTLSLITSINFLEQNKVDVVGSTDKNFWSIQSPEITGEFSIEKMRGVSPAVAGAALFPPCTSD